MRVTRLRFNTSVRSALASLCALPFAVLGSCSGQSLLDSFDSNAMDAVAPLMSAEETATARVERGYLGILGRPADAAGLAGYREQLLSGLSVERFAQALFTSKEFSASRSALSAEALADSLYRGLLDRAADPDGRAFTVAEIRAGRQALRAASMLTSQEFQERFLSGASSSQPAPPPGNISDIAADGPLGANAVLDWSSLPLRRPKGFSASASSQSPIRDNLDFNNPPSAGGGEVVLFDADGPGYLSRLWMTGQNNSGHIRMYFAGRSTPSIDVLLGQYFSGTYGPNAWPVGGSPLTNADEPTKRSNGYYSYLPINFQNHLKVTVSGQTYRLPSQTGANDQHFYYNINWQRYPGTSVGDFDPATQNSDFINAFRHAREPGFTPYSVPLQFKSRVISAPAGTRAALFDVEGPSEIAAIRLSFRIPGQMSPEAFKRSWLNLYRDGEESASVAAPLPYVFGTSSNDAPKTVQAMGFRFIARGDGLCEASIFFPMPFRTWMHAELHNVSPDDIDGVQVEWATRPTAGENRLPFHITYSSGVSPFGLPNVPSNDAVFLDTRAIGQDVEGHVVGVIHDFGVNGPVLEGNDNIYVDNEQYPSITGTGTEDFFNSAYYFGGGAFTLPTHGYSGGTSAYRLFLTDAISFSSRLEFKWERVPPAADGSQHWSAAVLWYGSSR